MEELSFPSTIGRSTLGPVRFLNSAHITAQQTNLLTKICISKIMKTAIQLCMLLAATAVALCILQTVRARPVNPGPDEDISELKFVILS